MGRQFIEFWCDFTNIFIMKALLVVVMDSLSLITKLHHITIEQDIASSLIVCLYHMIGCVVDWL